MEWWQILLAVLFNVPWIYAFIACVIVPSIKSIDKEKLVTALLSICAIVAALAAVSFFFSILILLVLGSTMPNPEVMPPTIAVSGIVLLITIVILLIFLKRR